MTIYLRPAAIVPKRTRAPLRDMQESTRIVRGDRTMKWCEWPDDSPRTRCGRLVVDSFESKVKRGAVTCEWCKRKAARGA